MNYKDSGVDTGLAGDLLHGIKNDIGFTVYFNNQVNNESVISKNDYCSCVELNRLKYTDPVLTFSTDGVGTKLLLAERFYEVESNVAQDLFAMIFNDVVCSGSRPLYFLDYYATRSLKETLKNGVNRFETILKDLARICSEHRVAIVGGETAEMPLVYSKNRFDLAGFGVGVVEKANLISPERVRYNDVVIGIESSGPHSNGYSLINHLVDSNRDKEFVEACLKPTRVYVRPVMDLLDSGVDVHGVAHVTGGGITENLPRIIPDDLCCLVDLYTWRTPRVFQEIKTRAKVSSDEMLKTFNCGIGMIVIVTETDKRRTLEVLNRHHHSHQIGRVRYRERDSVVYWGEK